MEIKKNIAIIIPSLGMGGAERVASELANEFKKNKINVSIMLLDKNDIYYELNEDIKTYFVEYDIEKNKIIRNISRIRKLRKLLKDKNIDVAISFLTSANFLTIFATRFTRIKAYVSERSDPNRNTKKIKILRNILYRFSSGIICQTQDAKEYFPKKIQKKSKVIVNPIKSNLPKWSSVENHTNSIITAVRLEKSKNIPMLLDAFSKVHKIDKEAKLIIYGDGPERDNIKNKINELKLEDKVILKGKSNEWHNEAIKSTVFVLSSDYEGMSNSLLEALAMGMPVVSTDHPIGGARTVIADGKNGFLVPVNNSGIFAEKILQLLEDNELQKKFSSESDKILDIMNIQQISKRWLSYVCNIEEVEN